MTVSASVPMTRRALLVRFALVSGAGAALAGCDHPARATRPRPVGPTAAEVVARAAADQESALVAVYSAALDHYPRQRSALAAVLAEHRAHLYALRHAGGVAVAVPSASASASSGASPSASSGSSRPVGPLPARPAAAMRHLRNLERVAAGQRRSSCLAVRSDPTVAELLGSISASESAHAVLLGALVARAEESGEQSGEESAEEAQP